MFDMFPTFLKFKHPIVLYNKISTWKGYVVRHNSVN